MREEFNKWFNEHIEQKSFDTLDDFFFAKVALGTLWTLKESEIIGLKIELDTYKHFYKKDLK